MPAGPTGRGIEGERDHNMVVAAVRRATAANAEINRRFMGSSVSSQRFVSGTGWEVQRRRSQKCGSIKFWARRIKADADISLQRRFLE
jgi:hypothetical protein